MAKRIFIWKNRKCAGINPEWEEISVFDLIKMKNEFRGNENKESRYLARVPGVEDEDDYYLLECTHKEFLRSQKEKQKRQRKKKDKEDFDRIFEIVSMDLSFESESGENYSLHDLVRDESVNVEKDAIKNLVCKEINKIVESLPYKEKQIIKLMFYGPEQLSEREAARILGVPRTTLYDQKRKIFEKIKKSFGQN